MRVLVAFESSGVVRRAFAARGHQAYSLDILPSVDDSPNHIQGDAIEILSDLDFTSSIDLLICHPPCTYLASSGLHWNKRIPGRSEKTDKALNLIMFLMCLPVKRICIENPVGCISTRIRKASQYIQPHQFQHDASKKTGLWLTGLPLLKPTGHIEPRYVNGKPRWSNQTDSGQNKLTPSPDRWRERSKTYSGIADAMAAQWGDL